MCACVLAVSWRAAWVVECKEWRKHNARRGGGGGRVCRERMGRLNGCGGTCWLTLAGRDPCGRNHYLQDIRAAENLIQIEAGVPYTSDGVFSDFFFLISFFFFHAYPLTLETCNLKAFSNPQTIALMCIRPFSGEVIALPEGIWVVPVALVLVSSNPN